MRAKNRATIRAAFPVIGRVANHTATINSSRAAEKKLIDTVDERNNDTISLCLQHRA